MSSDCSFQGCTRIEPYADPEIKWHHGYPVKIIEFNVCMDCEHAWEEHYTIKTTLVESIVDED